jgi:hypothetical protein
MKADKTFWRQFNDDRISDIWKMPRRARDWGYNFAIIAFFLGAALVLVLAFSDLIDKKENQDLIDVGNYQIMILKYADCHTIKLILANEPLDHTFRERLSSVWLVNCSK